MNKRLIVLGKCLNYLCLMEEFYNLNFIIKEAASKFNVLKKLGLSEQTARAIDDICKGLSVWIFNKLIEHIISEKIETEEDLVINTKKQAIKYIDSYFADSEFSEKTKYIMDWIHVDLDGNNSAFKDLSFKELYQKSEDWLNTNYIEKNKIILDFRDKDGIGYYWADLGPGHSAEEACRMNHCGDASLGNNIYSLRRVIKQNLKSNEEYSVNKSILTLEINPNGEIKQLKGSSNSKPEKEYHYFIKELLKFKELDEKGVPKNKISGFTGLEENDFHIEDLSEQDKIEVYNENPNIFKTIYEKCIVALAGAKGIEEQMYAEFEISEEMLKKMLKSNYKISDIYNIIEDPMYFSDMFIDYTGISDVINCIIYINPENEQKAIKALKPDFPQIEEMELSNKIFNLKNIISLDKNHFRKTSVYEAIINSIIAAREDVASNYFYKELKDALSSFGIVSITEKDRIKIRTNLIQLIKSISGTSTDYILKIIKDLEKDYKYDDIKEFMPDFIMKCIEEDVLKKEDFYINFNNLYFDKEIFNNILSSEL